MSDKDGGPAYPVSVSVDSADQMRDSTEYGYSGMSLRDYFAGQALIAVCNQDTSLDVFSPELAASGCYSMADAMIAEREK